jgi:hypothetical protein
MDRKVDKQNSFNCQLNLTGGIGGRTRPLQNSRLIDNLDPQKMNVLGAPAILLQSINEDRRKVSRLSVQNAGVDLIQGLAVQALYIFQISPPELLLLI